MGYASFVYDARLPQSKDALLSVLAESSSPEREFSCVTFNNLGYNLDMEVPAPALVSVRRTMRVYKRDVGPEMSGNITASVSQHSDGSSVYYEKAAPDVETSVVLYRPESRKIYSQIF